MGVPDPSAWPPGSGQTGRLHPVRAAAIPAG